MYFWNQYSVQWPKYWVVEVTIRLRNMWQKNVLENWGQIFIFSVFFSAYKVFSWWLSLFCDGLKQPLVQKGMNSPLCINKNIPVSWTWKEVNLYLKQQLYIACRTSFTRGEFKLSPSNSLLFMKRLKMILRLSP